VDIDLLTQEKVCVLVSCDFFSHITTHCCLILLHFYMVFWLQCELANQYDFMKAENQLLRLVSFIACLLRNSLWCFV